MINIIKVLLPTFSYPYLIVILSNDLHFYSFQSNFFSQTIYSKVTENTYARSFFLHGTRGEPFEKDGTRKRRDIFLDGCLFTFSDFYAIPKLRVREIGPARIRSHVRARPR